jgi:hypothetical protein
LTGDFVALDEAMILPERRRRHWSRRWRPGPWQSAGLVRGERGRSAELEAARGRVGAGQGAGVEGLDPRLAYFDFSAGGRRPGPVPEAVRTDPAVWAQANPGSGSASRSSTSRTSAAARSAAQFAVERLGVGDWPDTSDDAERVISAEAFAACAELDESNRIVTVPAFAVDVNPDRTWGAIGVGGFREDGRPQVAVVTTSAAPTGSSTGASS